MNWKLLYSFYHGLLGKALVFIALSTPVSILIRNFDIHPWSFIISLIGALVILLGFIICSLFTPDLIKKFTDAQDYADYLQKISEDITLSTEFSILDKVKDELPSNLDTISLDGYKFTSVENTLDLGDERKAIRILSIIKYSYFLRKQKNIRIALTLILLIGFFIIFFPTIYNIYTILEVATNV